MEYGQGKHHEEDVEESDIDAFLMEQAEYRALEQSWDMTGQEC